MPVPVPQETQRRILSISRSTPLLIGRNDLLATAGYTVFSPKEPLDALLLLEQDPYLAVLIGHSVLEEEGSKIAEKARGLAIPAVFIYEGTVRTPGWADLAINSSSEMALLLSFLEQRSYPSPQDRDRRPA